MKKLLLVGLLIFTVVICAHPLFTWLGGIGMQNPQKGWAAPLTFTSGSILFYTTGYPETLTVLEKAIVVFPQDDGVSQACFLIGQCYEKEQNNAKARLWYERTLARWPNHAWAGEMRRRLNAMEVQEDR